MSIATVSRVVNGRSDVSSTTREAVRRVMREQGYHAGPRARPGAEAAQTGLVGVTMPVIHHGYFASILSGAAEALYERDMRIVLCPTRHEHDREVSLLERLMHGETDGAILILPEESNTELRTLTRHGFRFVVVDPLTELAEGLPVVSAAHSSGATQATRHLLDLGHRRIGVITGPEGGMASEERLRGHQAALAAAGVLPEACLVMRSNFRVDGGYKAARRLLGLPAPPTAIFTFNDSMAIGTLQAARERGLRIPEDLSVVGFDDTVEAVIAVPALTTVRQPLAEMGRMAVVLLLQLLEKRRLEPLRVQLATRLVIRDSTAPPRTGSLPPRTAAAPAGL